jgi:hypothetical protein
LTDSFLEEVEERLRSDRYRSLSLRVLPWVIGLVVLALLAAGAWWGYREWRKREGDKASEAYAVALATAQGGDLDKAFAEFAKVAELNSPAYDAVSLMSQGAVKMEQNKVEEAVKLFDQAAKASDAPPLQDAARLKAALALMDTAPYAAIEERLTPVAAEGRPYRPFAREALAMAKVQAGRFREAREDFAILPLLPGVPDTMAERAEAMVALIDSGSAAALPQIARTMRQQQSAGAAAQLGPAQARPAAPANQPPAPAPAAPAPAQSGAPQ